MKFTTLFTSLIVGLWALPVAAQEEPDTTNVEEEIVIEVIHADEDVTLRPGRALRLDRNRMGRMENVEIQGDTMFVVVGDRTRNERPYSVRFWSETVRDGERGQIRSRRFLGPRIVGRNQGQGAELRRMESKARELARAVRDASDEDRGELEAALRAHLAEMLDHKLSLEARAIDEAQEELSRRRETLAQRQENHAQIVQERMNQLLGRGSAYQW